MSQRTRVPTTGAATPPPSASPSRRTRRSPAQPADQAAAPSTSDQAGASLAGLGPEHLARALRAVASELERDPALARRVSEAVYLTPQPPSPGGKGEPAESIVPPASRERSREPAVAVDAKPSRGGKKGGHAPKQAGHTFQPRVVEGVSAALGPGILDPFAVRAAGGEAGLRTVLAELRLGSLRAIVREHKLDPEGVALRGNDAERLRALIVERTATVDARSR